MLRDRAMDLSFGHDALECYTGLLKTLISSKETEVGSYASKNRIETVELSPSRVIGLSSIPSMEDAAARISRNSKDK